MSTEDDKKAGLVPSRSSALSRSGATSLIRRGMRDLIAIGDAARYCNLGHDYYSGQGVPQDYKQATFWFRKAAEGGDADGQFMLAAMYLEGEGVPHDAEEAILWFRKSADQDDVGAQIVLGSIYEAGEIVPQDYAQAANWYLKVAILDGWEDIQHRLGHMYENGLGVPKDRDQALRWYRRAAESGNEPSREALDRVVGKLERAEG